MKKKKQAKAKRYSLLLNALVFLFLVSPFLSSLETTHSIFPILFFVILIITLKDLQLPKRVFIPIVSVACAGLFLEHLVRYVCIFTELGKWITLITAMLYALFIGFTILILLKQIFSQKTVSQDTIRGGISIYLLLGYLWALLYIIVTYFNPLAFTLAPEAGELLSAMVYFSFTTLTTLGYGDIVPTHEMARVLTNLEAVVGQVFLTVFIARLVGLHIVAQTKMKKTT